MLACDVCKRGELGNQFSFRAVRETRKNIPVRYLNQTIHMPLVLW